MSTSTSSSKTAARNGGGVSAASYPTLLAAIGGSGFWNNIMFSGVKAAKQGKKAELSERLPDGTTRMPAMLQLRVRAFRPQIFVSDKGIKNCPLTIRVDSDEIKKLCSEGNAAINAFVKANREEVIEAEELRTDASIEKRTQKNPLNRLAYKEKKMVNGKRVGDPAGGFFDDNLIAEIEMKDDDFKRCVIQDKKTGRILKLSDLPPKFEADIVLEFYSMWILNDLWGIKPRVLRINLIGEFGNYNTVPPCLDDEQQALGAKMFDADGNLTRAPIAIPVTNEDAESSSAVESSYDDGMEMDEYGNVIAVTTTKRENTDDVDDNRGGKRQKLEGGAYSSEALNSFGSSK